MSVPQAIPGDDVRTGDADTTPWWVALIAAVVLFLVSLVIFALPGVTVALTMRFVSLFWLVDGVVCLACLAVDRSNWGWKVAAGILSVLGGITVIQHPLWSGELAPSSFGLVVGSIAILIGIVQLILAYLGSGWRTGIPGIVSLVIGVLVALNPLMAAAVLPRALGGTVLAGGVAATVMAFTRRSAGRRRAADTGVAQDGQPAASDIAERS